MCTGIDPCLYACDIAVVHFGTALRHGCKSRSMFDGANKAAVVNYRFQVAIGLQYHTATCTAAVVAAHTTIALQHCKHSCIVNFSGHTGCKVRFIVLVTPGEKKQAYRQQKFSFVCKGKHG